MFYWPLPKRLQIFSQQKADVYCIKAKILTNNNSYFPVGLVSVVGPDDLFASNEHGAEHWGQTYNYCVTK